VIDEVGQPVAGGVLRTGSARGRCAETFLRENLFRHYQVARMTSKARRIVRELFAAFWDDVRLLPTTTACGRVGSRAHDRDYVAGMTDRYAILEHRRLFAVGEV